MLKGVGNKGKGKAKPQHRDDDDQGCTGLGRGYGHGRGATEGGKRCRTKDMNPPKHRKTGSAHKFGFLNAWTPERMQAAIDLYKQRLATYKNPRLANASWCAQQYSIPESTFYNRVSDCPSSHKISGCKHESGGARRLKIFTHSQFISNDIYF